MCGEKKKWILIDRRKHLNSTGAAAGAAIGSVVRGLNPVVGALIGSAVGKGKRTEQYCCGKCGFSHEYEA